MRNRAKQYGVVAFLLSGLAVLGASGCDEKVDRAADCGRLALSTSKSIEELERAALGSALDQDTTEVHEKLDEDIEKVKDRTSNPDVAKVADKVSEAAKDAYSAIREDRKPDFSPLKEAGVELTKVCTTS